MQFQEIFVALLTDEALTTPMIWCGYKQINTNSIQKQFSIGAYESHSGGILDGYINDQPGPSASNNYSLSPPDLSTFFHVRPPSTRSRLSTPTNPSWLRGASKLLDSGFNHDRYDKKLLYNIYLISYFIIYIFS